MKESQIHFLSSDQCDNYAFAVFIFFIPFFSFKRRFIGINPERGSKATHGKVISKRTGKVVQKRAESVNPHVATLLKNLLDFEWDFIQVGHRCLVTLYYLLAPAPLKWYTKHSSLLINLINLAKQHPRILQSRQDHCAWLRRAAGTCANNFIWFYH